MTSHQESLIQAIGVTYNRRHWAEITDETFLSELNRLKPKTVEALADVWYNTQTPNESRSYHYNSSRYHMLNLHSYFTKGTVEFRLFQFENPTEARKNGLHAGQLKSYIQLCLAMVQYSKMVKTVRPGTIQDENPKYAMRTWLCKLGMIGDEFIIARDVLTKRLPGDTAFRDRRRG